VQSRLRRGAGSEKERCPDVLVLTCGMRINYVLSQTKSGAVVMECTHEEDQTDKQGLYQTKRNDEV